MDMGMRWLIVGFMASASLFMITQCVINFINSARIKKLELALCPPGQAQQQAEEQI